MDADARQFIENSTLLFIASRNVDGAMDVSPRGGQPSVLKVTEDGRLVLPDYNGNRRLDTIANILANPHVSLLILNRACNRFLHIRANAKVSFDADDLFRFPADENQPISVLVLTPRSSEFVASPAFERANFWIDPGDRRPPLDLGAIIDGDKAAQAGRGFLPVGRAEVEERDLKANGVRDAYGPPMEGVDQKIGGFAGPGALRFMKEAAFTVLAREGQDAQIVVDIVAEAPLTVIPFGNRHVYCLNMPEESAASHDGECALLTMVPGQNELLRINGRLEPEPGAVKIAPREVYFHCSAALSRSRIWQQDRRSFWSGKRRFRCVEKYRENPEVTSFVLAPCDQAPIGTILPGQYVTVAVSDGSGKRQQRSYSVSRRPDDKTLRISVRRVGAGGVSDMLHNGIEPGMELLVGVPAGRFVLASKPGHRVVLISAGVGITPLLPMLDELARENSGREVWFIHAARDGANHLFKDEARAIAVKAKKGGIRLISCYSRPARDDHPDLTGRINSEVLAGLFPVKDTDFYICGPDIFMTSLRDGLVSLGAQPGSIRFEAFGAPCGPVVNLAGKDIVAGSRVTFARSGKSALWSPADGTLLDLALKNKIDVAYSCRLGDCQSCVQKVIDGVVDHLGDEVPLLSLNQALLCLGIPRGDLLIDC